MRQALLLSMLLAAIAGGSRLIAQDGYGTAGPAAGGCAGGNCGCANGGCDDAGCNYCGTVGHFHALCTHCRRGICTICNHPPHHGNRAAQYRASQAPWHGGYYYTQWGAPVSLVIPPNAEMHTDYSWGVPSSRVSRNDWQFQRGFPGGASGTAAGGRYGFLPTPQYPSDTNQFGVYYVRGPW